MHTFAPLSEGGKPNERRRSLTFDVQAQRVGVALAAGVGGRAPAREEEERGEGLSEADSLSLASVNEGRQIGLLMAALFDSLGLMSSFPSSPVRAPLSGSDGFHHQSAGVFPEFGVVFQRGALQRPSLREAAGERESQAGYL